MGNLYTIFALSLKLYDKQMPKSNALILLDCSFIFDIVQHSSLKLLFAELHDTEFCGVRCTSSDFWKHRFSLGFLVFLVYTFPSSVASTTIWGVRSPKFISQTQIFPYVLCFFIHFLLDAFTLMSHRQLILKMFKAVYVIFLLKPKCCFYVFLLIHCICHLNEKHDNLLNHVHQVLYWKYLNLSYFYSNWHSFNKYLLSMYSVLGQEQWTRCM